MMLGRWRLHVVAALLALASTPTLASAQTRWEVFVYVAADNESEGHRVNDVLELIEQDNENVDVLVQIDRAAGRDETAIPGLDGTAGAFRFRASAGAARNVESLGRIDSGSPARLQEFLAWALANQAFTASDSNPVAHALVILGPGSGWRGLGQDLGTRMASSLTVNDVADAARTAFQGTSSLQLVALDGAYLATVENLGPIARAMNEGGRIVASQGVLPGEGFALGPWIASITADATASSPAFVAASLVDTFATASYAGNNYILGSFQASFLSGRLTTRFIELAGALEGQALTDNHAILAAARSATFRFGNSGSNDPYSLYDARDLFQRAATLGREAMAISGALTPPMVEEPRLEAAYVRKSPRYRNAGGISVYLPAERPVTAVTARVDTTEGGGGEAWQRFVAAFASLSMADQTPPAIEGARVEEVDPEEPPPGAGNGGMRNVRFTAQTVGNDIDDLTFVLGVRFEGGVAFFGETPVDQGGGGDDLNGGPVEIQWNGTWMALGNRGSEAVELAALFVVERYVDEGGAERALYAVPVRLDSGSDDVELLEDGILLFDVGLDSLGGSLVGAFAVDSESEADGVYEIDLESDALVYPQIPVVGDTGEFELLDLGVALSISGLEVVPVMIEDGPYEVGLVVTDIHGNQASELIPVYLGADPAPGGGCSATPSRAPLSLGLGLLAALAVLALRRRRALGPTVLGLALIVTGCSSQPVSPVDARPVVRDAGPCEDDDGDGVCNRSDSCWGHDDRQDADGDEVPDGCDCDASGDACDPNADCRDGDEGVVCLCRAGFTGDGTSCTPRTGMDGGMGDGGMPMDGGTPSDGGVEPMAPPAVVLGVAPSLDTGFLGSVTESGEFGSFRSTSTLGTGWDYATGVLVPGSRLARVLLYNSATGAGRFVSIDVDRGSSTTLIASLGFSAGWDDIVPVACDRASCDRYFFHDTETALVAVLELTETDGTWTSAQTDSGTLPGGIGQTFAWRMAWDDGSGQSIVGTFRTATGFFARLRIVTSGAERGRIARGAGGVILLEGLGGAASPATVTYVSPLDQVGYLAGVGVADEVLVYRAGAGGAEVARLAPGVATSLATIPNGTATGFEQVTTLDNGVTLFSDPTFLAGFVDPVATPVFRETLRVDPAGAAAGVYATALITRP